MNKNIKINNQITQVREFESIFDQEFVQDHYEFIEPKLTVLVHEQTKINTKIRVYLILRKPNG